MTPAIPIRKPSLPIPTSALPHLRDLDRAALVQRVNEVLGGPAFRGRQVFAWVHARDVADFAGMSDLSLADRTRLAQNCSLERLHITERLFSADGTCKLRLRTTDGHFIESVLIPNEDRGYTQCVSSMVGCSLTCRFCATASLGFLRNLATWEIVDQVYRGKEVLAEREGSRARISNLVFMGMGEPLHNFNKVKAAIELLVDPDGAAFSGRRITVSTAGFVPGIERFAREGLGEQVGLAVSLNATTNAQRDEIMPINRRWNLEALLASVRNLPAPTRRRVTFEYVLLAGQNDAVDDARRLIKLLAPLRCHVNLIPWNPHPHAPYTRPAPEVVEAFAARCQQGGLRAFVRRPRGDDIGAACGQLALEEPARAGSHLLP